MPADRGKHLTAPKFQIQPVCICPEQKQKESMLWSSYMDHGVPLQSLSSGHRGQGESRLY